jgi:hypothetical protein
MGIFNQHFEALKLEDWTFDPQVEKSIIKTLTDLLSKDLVGQTITSAQSVTVSSEVAASLWERGEKAVAEAAIEKAFLTQITEGKDAGAFKGMGLEQPSIWATYYVFFENKTESGN